MFGVGKYKMRNGGDAEVVAVVNGIAIGFVDNDPVDTATWISKTGGFFIDASGESRFDLIDPNAKKTIRVEAWVTVYLGDGCPIGGGYSSLEEAQQKKQAGCIAIAKVEIDCVEGDNLD